MTIGLETIIIIFIMNMASVILLYVFIKAMQFISKKLAGRKGNGI